jgi:hypothetical protein
MIDSWTHDSDVAIMILAVGKVEQAETAIG